MIGAGMAILVGAAALVAQHACDMYQLIAGHDQSKGERVVISTTTQGRDAPVPNHTKLAPAESAPPSRMKG
jgi:hypothetical protein